METIQFLDLCRPLIKAVESTNKTLKEHHERTSVIAYNIAIKMNLSSNELLQLIVATALHDIGSLYVNDKKSNSVPFNNVQQANLAHEMLLNFDSFSYISQIIKNQNIRYIDYLSLNEKIPIQSFIIFIANQIDLLINKNEYTLSQKEKIIEEITIMKGNEIHPVVYDAFISASKEYSFWLQIDLLKTADIFDKVDMKDMEYMSVENIVLFSKTLSHIIDFKNKYAGIHSQSVAHVAYFLGDLIGFEEDKCIRLMIAGLLHDIGKVAVPQIILDKPGKLNKNEFLKMQSHVYYTSYILDNLKDNEMFRDIYNWACNHHERMDGTGYPMAKSASGLDQGSRIIAISDIITSLLEDRTYRKKKSNIEICDILRELSQNKIDSKIADVAIENIDSITEIISHCHFDDNSIFKSIIKI